MFSEDYVSVHSFEGLRLLEVVLNGIFAQTQLLQELYSSDHLSIPESSLSPRHLGQGSVMKNSQHFTMERAGFPQY